MSKQLTVEVRQKTSKTGEANWEGRVTVPGTNATRLAKKDGSTSFPTRGSLNSVARALGQRLKLDVEFSEPQRKAAKKSVKNKTTKAATATKTSSKKTTAAPTN